jgi:hypothetical protein
MSRKPRKASKRPDEAAEAPLQLQARQRQARRRARLRDEGMVLVQVLVPKDQAQALRAYAKRLTEEAVPAQIQAPAQFPPMRHRNMDVPLLHPSQAAVHSILERGGASDIRALFAAVYQEPWGDLARAALAAAAKSEVYGYPALLAGIIERARSISLGMET